MVKITPSQIENWVGAHFQYKRRSHGRQLAINNPFSPDNGYHFWISLFEDVLTKGPLKGKKNFWVYDFRGSDGSSFINFVKKYKKISYHQAIAEITKLSNRDIRSLLISHRNKLQEHEEEIEIDESINLPKLSKLLDGDHSKIADIARNYLNHRRVSDEMIKTYQLYYTPGSIVFPYIEYGSIVFWQERDILNKNFNFPNEEQTGLRKTDFLYGFDNVEPHQRLFIVESIFNSFTIGDNCVASGGAKLAGKQLNKIQYMAPKEIILCPDNDKAGLESIIANYYFLKNIFPNIFFSIPNGPEDWNELEQKEYGLARKILDRNIHRLSIPIIVKLKAKVASMKK